VGGIRQHRDGTSKPTSAVSLRSDIEPVCSFDTADREAPVHESLIHKALDFLRAKFVRGKGALIERRVVHRIELISRPTVLKVEVLKITVLRVDVPLNCSLGSVLRARHQRDRDEGRK
jgi:hypothetical protein